MTEQNENAPVTVTIKAGPGFEAPWIVYRGDTNEDVKSLLADGWKANLAGAVLAFSETFRHEYAGGATAKPADPSPTPQQAVQNVVQAVDGQVVGQEAVGQAAPTQAPTAGVQSPSSETDKFGRTFEYSRPDAPQTAYGPKVLMSATSQAGKPYKAWLDPRDKRTPANYRAGNRTNPDNLIEQEFANIR